MNAIVETNNGNATLMSFIERAARDPEFDVQKLEALLRLQREVSHDQARRAFNAAMAAAQAQMLPVVRDARNSHLNNKYAKLETIDAAMRPIYTQHGFSVRYGSAPTAAENSIRITCTVAHEGGYFEENYLDAPLGTGGPQGGRTATTPVQSVGSAVTYLRRYLLSMVFNVVLADDDDDGEGARRTAAAAMRRGARVTEPDARDALNASVPLDQQADAAYPPRQPSPPVDTTGLAKLPPWKEFLAALAISMRDCSSLSEANRIISRPDVQTAKATYKDVALQQLNAIIAGGIAAHAPITHDEETPVDDDPFAPGLTITGEEKLGAG